MTEVLIFDYFGASVIFFSIFSKIYLFSCSKPHSVVVL